MAKPDFSLNCEGYVEEDSPSSAHVERLLLDIERGAVPQSEFELESSVDSIRIAALYPDWSDPDEDVHLEGWTVERFIRESKEVDVFCIGEPTAKFRRVVRYGAPAQFDECAILSSDAASHLLRLLLSGDSTEDFTIHSRRIVWRASESCRKT